MLQKSHDDVMASPLSAMPKGIALLQDPALNKGTAFTEAERDRSQLRGLLPPHVASQEQQLERVLENFRRKPSDLETRLDAILQEDSDADGVSNLIELLTSHSPGRSFQRSVAMRWPTPLLRNPRRTKNSCTSWPPISPSHSAAEPTRAKPTLASPTVARYAS